MNQPPGDQEKVWELAKYFAISFGEVPNSFSGTIRALVADDAKSSDAYSTGSRFMAGRLLKSSSVAVPLRGATQLFFPDKADAVQNASPEAFLALYKPVETAALLGVVYAYKKVKKRSPSEEWEHFSSVLTRCIDLGGLIGRALPRVGFSLGLLAGAFTAICQVPFLLQNPKEFKAYRRKLGKTQPYDLALQLESFGCTHIHIATMLLPTLGYGVPLSKLVTEGLMGEILTAPTPDSEMYRSYIAAVWLKGLYATGAVPDMVHKGGFYPLKADLDRLLEGVAKTQNSPSWLESIKADELPEESQSEQPQE